MKIGSMLLIVLVAALSAATWTSQSSAAGRDEAISRCIAQAKKQTPRQGNHGASYIFVQRLHAFRRLPSVSRAEAKAVSACSIYRLCGAGPWKVKPD